MDNWRCVETISTENPARGEMTAMQGSARYEVLLRLNRQTSPLLFVRPVLERGDLGFWHRARRSSLPGRKLWRGSEKFASRPLMARTVL
jgi:hypothetical protein